MIQLSNSMQRPAHMLRQAQHDNPQNTASILSFRPEGEMTRQLVQVRFCFLQRFCNALWICPAGSCIKRLSAATALDLFS